MPSVTVTFVIVPALATTVSGASGRTLTARSAGLTTISAGVGLAAGVLDEPLAPALAPAAEAPLPVLATDTPEQPARPTAKAPTDAAAARRAGDGR